MITQKKQALKRFTYICLSLSSITLSSEAQARKGSLKDWIDHPVNGGGYISVPRLGKNIADELEASNLMGPGSKIFKRSEVTIKRDLSSSPRGEIKQCRAHTYSELKNEVIDKYEKQRTELERFRNSSKSKNQSPGLAAQTKQFGLVTGALEKEMEEYDKEVSDYGKTAVKIADTMAETAIKNGIKDKEGKSILIKLKENIKEELLKFFN